MGLQAHLSFYLCNVYCRVLTLITRFSHQKLLSNESLSQPLNTQDSQCVVLAEEILALVIFIPSLSCLIIYTTIDDFELDLAALHCVFLDKATAPKKSKNPN